MSERIPHADMADELARLVYGKTDWLSRFGAGKNKRADHDIERTCREREVLRQAEYDYRKASERAA